MGWTEGKGLGANEDGRVDYVQVDQKCDNAGSSSVVFATQFLEFA